MAKQDTPGQFGNKWHRLREQHEQALGGVEQAVADVQEYGDDVRKYRALLDRVKQSLLAADEKQDFDKRSKAAEQFGEALVQSADIEQVGRDLAAALQDALQRLEAATRSLHDETKTCS